jgi:glycosyltransferase involved in cell wall biosynthesis
MTRNLPKNIAILMAAYNGQSYLREQLDSIAAQSYQNWTLHVIDDGSQDQTWEILQEYQKQLGAEKLQIIKSPNRGCATTFLSLVCDPHIQADYYAFTDQDDIWDANKLAKATAFLDTQDPNISQLYCSSARLIDAEGHAIGRLPIKTRPPSFQNALVQCITTGNTMVFNNPARDILLAAGMVDIPLHDWWVYLAITACGGEAYYDSEPSLNYRQHGKNYMGFRHNIFRRYLKTLERVLDNQFIKINTAQIAALNKIYDKLTPQAKITFDDYQRSLRGNVFARLYYLYQSGVYRQEIPRTIAVYLAQLMRKL